jgi:hypothetical protein
VIVLIAVLLATISKLKLFINNRVKGRKGPSLSEKRKTSNLKMAMFNQGEATRSSCLSKADEKGYPKNEIAKSRGRGKGMATVKS